VARTPSIPPDLTRKPFSLDEARDAGLTHSALRGKTWQRLGAGLYRWTELPKDHWLTLHAWRRVLLRETVFVGASAGWLHGLDLDPTNPVEIAVPPSYGHRSRAGLAVRHLEIPREEVATIRGLRAATLPLALAGLCLQRPAVEALVAIDMAIRLALTDCGALTRYADAAKGRPGIARLRSLASLADAAESPMETRLRWLLIQAGLPRPKVQTDLRDSSARFVGRADLYYPDARLVLEYDGGNHRERLVDDDLRQNLLVGAGYQVLRFTSADLHSRAEVTVAQVRAALETGASKAHRLIKTRGIPDFKRTA